MSRPRVPRKKVSMWDSGYGTVCTGRLFRKLLWHEVLGKGGRAESGILNPEVFFYKKL